MIDKGNCGKCSRKIQATLLNKCMFCGEALPEGQKFSEEEMGRIRAYREHCSEMDEIRREGKAIFDKWKENKSYIDWSDFIL